MIPLHCSPMNDRDAWKTEGICPDCASAILARVAELEAALGAALDPLDLYHAYGWQDRNGVRASLRRLLNH